MCCKEASNLSTVLLYSLVCFAISVSESEADCGVNTSSKDKARSTLEAPPGAEFWSEIDVFCGLRGIVG
ncbi:protein of unknown function (plasmid) [Cupriavidus taiwanensis]|uniref:Uncharacterized protein n=1 Tax=Cupriavidus taiwanensis TaxID=164546 RepID=A0A375JBM5_9BURK|nr:protein of unknown function [Cupriavidus taiwanensis]SPS02162.1 hypothetical protein CBM2634_P140006 [Cupriavidus taiwanensis]